MPPIEQVSKRLFSDRNWLKKCAIGWVLSIIPLVNIFAMGYLYQLFLAGRRGEQLSLPDWNDLKALFLDGLRFLVIGLIFAVLPLAMVGIVSRLAFDGLIAKIPLIPVAFMVGPLLCAALYLYSVKNDIADCFNLQALGVMLREAAVSYTMPTFAFLGICLLGWPLLPVAFFFGGLFYFYLMGYVFRDLQQRSRGA